MSLPTIQNLEAGRANPAYSTLRSVFEALGLELRVERRPVDWDNLAAHGAPLMVREGPPGECETSRSGGSLHTAKAVSLLDRRTLEEFVHRAADRVEGDWVLLARGRSARIHRPDADLYIRSKLGRLVESDLQGCLSMLRFIRDVRESIDEAGLRQVLHSEMAHARQEERRKRLEELLRHI